MKTDNKTLYIALGSLAIGLLLGWIFFGGSTTRTVAQQDAEVVEHTHEAGEVWTCSMHPQVREEGPGPCPFCGMDLIPVTSAEPNITAEGMVQMTSAAMQIANVQTVPVERAEPTKEIYLTGRIEADERRIAEITARFGGRIEKLFVNYTGQEVKRGQALASVYSPELVTAQKELFEAAKFRQTNPSFYEAAVNKLKLWDLSDRQIQNILESSEVRYNFNVLAPQSGTVVARHVSAGDYVKEGESMFEVANLDQLWVVFDAYESDLPWMQENDTIRFTVQSLPGRTFASEVTFIDPVISAERRVAEVRTEVMNDQGQLKPEMFVQGVLASALPGVDEALIVPKTAILWTGKRAVVYVKQPGAAVPTFAYREIVLGPEAGNFYVVNEGLEAGEEVVANGVFKVDAAAQLEGKASMMNPAANGSEREGSPDRYQGEVDQKGATASAVEPVYSDVNPAFAQQLVALTKPYFALKNALVASDAEAATVAAAQAQQALTDIDTTLVTGDARQRWTAYLAVMQRALENTTERADLATQRAALSSLSRALYRSLRQFNVTELDAYYQYCPMANNNAGAYWISERSEIDNPYFGEAMLNCGETRETL